MCYFTIVAHRRRTFRRSTWLLSGKYRHIGQQSNMHLPLSLDCLTLKVKALPFSVPSITNYRLTRRNISEDLILQRHGPDNWSYCLTSKLRLKCDGTRAESRFGLSAKRNTFKSAGSSVQSTAGSRVVRISGSNAGYIVFRGSVRVLTTHPIRQFPLHFPSRASPCAIRFHLDSISL